MKQPSSEEKAHEILRLLSLQLSYSAIQNGSQFSDAPFGYVPMREGAFWDTQMKTLPWKAGGPKAMLVREIDAVLKASPSDVAHFSMIPLDLRDGSLWQRIQSNFERAPDMMRDVIEPARERAKRNPHGLN